MPSVLFVCTANTCRSPMAETIFKNQLKQSRPDRQAWQVESAGTWAADGAPAALGAQAAMRKRGLSLANHHSQTVSEEMLAKFNLVLVMEANHKEALRAEFPHLGPRVFLLTEMAGKHLNIADPIGGSLQDYEATANEIEAWLLKGMEKIVRLAADVSG